jgi:hypothetical protein
MLVVVLVLVLVLMFVLQLYRASTDQKTSNNRSSSKTGCSETSADQKKKDIHGRKETNLLWTGGS